MFDWNDLRYFLELQRSGRLLTAAQRLKTTHATVARHIEAIEKSLGTALFVQHAQGYELTPAGEALLKHAEAMENVALLAEDELTHSAAPLGKIRLGVAEGLGVMFLAGRMGGLFERYPGLEVERQHPQPRSGDQHPPRTPQRRSTGHAQAHRLPPGALRQPRLPGAHPTD
jgi:DNA-binding transcriptional LysR family regulator